MTANNFCFVINVYCSYTSFVIYVYILQDGVLKVKENGGGDDDGALMCPTDETYVYSVALPVATEHEVCILFVPAPERERERERERETNQ